MPELNLPNMDPGKCTRLLASAQVPLASDEFKALLERMGTKDKELHVRALRTKKSGKTAVVLEERFGLDPLTDRASRASAEAFFKGEKKEKLAAALHLDVDIIVTLAAVAPDDHVEHRETLSRFWDWVHDTGSVKAQVRAWCAFPTTEFESVIELPLPVPSDVSGFTAISGLWLVSKDREAAQGTLYEVMLKSEEEDWLSGLAVFRTVLDGDASMMQTLLARATQIIDIAVHPRAKKGAEKE